MNWFNKMFMPWRKEKTVHDFDSRIAIKTWDGRTEEFYIMHTTSSSDGIRIELQDCKSVDRSLKLRYNQ